MEMTKADEYQRRSMINTYKNQVLDLFEYMLHIQFMLSMLSAVDVIFWKHVYHLAEAGYWIFWG